MKGPASSSSASPDAGPSPRARIWIRLLVAPAVLLVVVGVLWIHDQTGRWLPTDIVLMLLGAVGALEFAVLLLGKGFQGPGRTPDIVIATVTSGLLAGVGLLAPESAGLRMELRVLLVTLGIFATLTVHLRDTRPVALDQVARTLLAIIFVGLLFSWLREVAPGANSARVLLWVVLTAKASDMGGWVVGKPFGKHKMIPSVSPGKSWEGLAGGLFASAVISVLLPGILGIPQAEWSLVRLVLFGVVIGGASVYAGVLWSGFKRRLGAKDSSTLLPEMGGVLDMIDSLLVAGPVAWAWFRLGL